jgi:hypothetical protein
MAAIEKLATATKTSLIRFSRRYLAFALAIGSLTTACPDRMSPGTPLAPAIIARLPEDAGLISPTVDEYMIAHPELRQAAERQTIPGALSIDGLIALPRQGDRGE